LLNPFFVNNTPSTSIDSSKTFRLRLERKRARPFGNRGRDLSLSIAVSVANRGVAGPELGILVNGYDGVVMIMEAALLLHEHFLSP
jgi:hypothetical protein